MSDFENQDFNESIFDTIDDTAVSDAVRQKGVKPVYDGITSDTVESLEAMALRNSNETFKWGSAIGEAERIPGSRVRLVTDFECMALLRAITSETGDPRAKDSLDRIRWDLIQAHNEYPGEEYKKHGPHCSESVEAKANCVAEGHHIGWWHSNEAAKFYRDSDFEDGEIIAAKVPDDQDEHSYYADDESAGCQNAKCRLCYWEKWAEDLQITAEARHDERPDIMERMHSKLHQKLGTVSVSMVRVVQYPGEDGYDTSPHPEIPDHYGSAGPSLRQMAVEAWGEHSRLFSLVKFVGRHKTHYLTSVTNSDHPVTELNADPKTEAQNKLDIFWRETDNVVMESDDPYTTIPPKTQVKYAINEGGYVREVRVAVPGNKHLLVDTGSFPMDPPEYTNFPKPFLRADVIESRYVDKKKEEDRQHRLYMAQKALRETILKEHSTVADVLRARKIVNALVEPAMTPPRTYTYNREARGWTREGGQAMEPWLFKLIRNGARDVLSYANEEKHGRGFFDMVTLPTSSLHTRIAKQLKIIGPGSKYPRIESLPEPILFHAKEKMKGAKMDQKRLTVRGEQPLGNIPFRTYFCSVCKGEKLCLRDNWAAGRFVGPLQIDPGFYGTTDTWKCISCGNTIMRRALRMQIRTVVSGKDDPAIWTVTGLVYGDGFLRSWLSWNREHNPDIIRLLELARLVQDHMTANPKLRMAAAMDKAASFDDVV